MADDEALYDELMRRASDQLDDALQLLGIYVEEKTVVGRETPGGVQFAVAISGTIGRVAFSDRVQNPEQDRIDDQFAELVEDLDRDRGTDGGSSAETDQ